MDHLLRRATGDTEGLEQVSAVDGLVPLTLHYVHGKPLVPVAIGCRPDEANAVAELCYALPDGSDQIVRPVMESSE